MGVFYWISRGRRKREPGVINRSIEHAGDCECGPSLSMLAIVHAGDVGDSRSCDCTNCNYSFGVFTSCKGIAALDASLRKTRIKCRIGRL